MLFRCIDDMDSTRKDRSPCCDAQFPFEPHIFEYCLPQSISNMYDTTFSGPAWQDPSLQRLPDWRLRIT